MTEQIQSWMDYMSLDPTYRYLSHLKEEGWSNSAGDTFFEGRRRCAKKRDHKTNKGFYKMTVDIGKRLASETRIFDLRSACPQILDLCMAPGGFTTTAKARLPGSLIDAATLPPQAGGYEVMAENICQHIIYADITMYSEEMISDANIPAGHPDFENFEVCRPYIGNQYDIVICGGAVGEDHRHHHWKPYRRDCERSRLTTSQLVFAMNRLKPGGSMVLLLHHIEAWDTVCILHAFNEFSDIQLYKHPKHHALGSSFYLVAKNVNLDHDAARISLSYWKDLWRYLTFKDFENTPSPCSSLYGSEDAFVQKLLNEFGPYFLGLARPVWKIQAKALHKAPFTQHKHPCQICTQCLEDSRSQASEGIL